MALSATATTRGGRYPFQKKTVTKSASLRAALAAYPWPPWCRRGVMTPAVPHSLSQQPALFSRFVLAAGTDFNAHRPRGLRLPPDRILAELSRREELGSTGVGDGVAIPHARFPEINKAFGMLFRLRQPIDFDALDGKPIDLVFLLLLPESTKGEQLSALACVARKLRSHAVTAGLRHAGDGTQIFHLLASE
jgi:PTS system nitrogen regulatory IIA component